jgi:glycerol kinase
MVLHALVVKAMPTVVTGVVGVAAYEALVRAPWRKATVMATAWGIRVAREAERKAGASAEQARLTVADVVAEARERAGQEVSPLTVTGSGDDE